MRRAWTCWGTAALLLVMAGAAAGQEPTGIRRTEAGVVLDFQAADLRVVIGALAELAGLNIIYGNLPDRKVTVRTPGPVSREVVRQYLESLVESNGLEMVEEGGVVRISGGAAEAQTRPTAPTRPRAAVPGAGRRETPRLYVYPLKHAHADELAETLSALFGTGIGGAGAGGGLVSLSEELRQQRTLPMLPEAPAAPGAAGAGEIEGQPGVSTGLRGAVQIVPDLRANSLLIRATAEDYETIRAAIEQLDTRPLQVLIEVLIAEVVRTDNADLGISVEVPDQRDSESGALIGGSLTGAAGGPLTVRVGDLGPIDADVALNALASSSDVTILSRPVILAQNNQDARILVGSQRPFIQLFRALPTDAAVRDQVVQYRNVGTQLTIRPTISPDGYISLSILQEVSSATTQTQFGAPVISTREAETQLLVQDGHTVVIGGLIDQQDEHTENGIPILKDIPILGALFRSTHNSTVRTELFLILTPHVIRTDADMDETTRRLRDSTDELGERLPDPIPLFTPDTTRIPLPPDTVRQPPPDTLRQQPDSIRRRPAPAARLEAATPRQGRGAAPEWTSPRAADSRPIEHRP
ncbi:MAG TPA: secretin N-terminal domain-containing protein [Longimicrobiales bacterium]